MDQQAHSWEVARRAWGLLGVGKVAVAEYVESKRGGLDLEEAGFVLSMSDLCCSGHALHLSSPCHVTISIQFCQLCRTCQDTMYMHTSCTCTRAGQRIAAHAAH